VAIATLAVFIGAGGLGTQIYGSGNLTFPTSIIIAAAIAMTMALGLDLVLLTVQRLTTPWRRLRTV
jgi:osmoprotectant transport system permease protein